MNVKDSFKIPGPTSLPGSVGHEVVFNTSKEMDFDDWKHGGVGQPEQDGVSARMGKVEVKFGLKTMMTYLVFPFLHTRPDMLIFDEKKIGLGLIGVGAFLASGRLHLEGQLPSDFIELPTPSDIVPTKSNHSHTDALLLSFPTQKSGLGDLTENDRKRLRDFVADRAKAIKALSDAYSVKGTIGRILVR